MADLRSINVRTIESADLKSIRLILETWMRDEPGGEIRVDNVEQVIAAMAASLTSDDPTYLVAYMSGDVVGVAGFTAVDIDPLLVENAMHPIEIINVYVAPEVRGRGIGTMLVNEIENAISSLKCDTLLVVSGSRNRQYGYPFWDRRFGRRFRSDIDYFGPTPSVSFGRRQCKCDCVIGRRSLAMQLVGLYSSESQPR